MADTSQEMQATAPIVPPGTKVAVTGATGFIGGRLVERLAEQGATITCLLRGTSPATRLQQTGAGIRRLDLTDPEQVRAALEGIELVFHCAYDWADPGWNHAALRALIAACRTNACRRLVHVSSFVVHQLPAAGEVTEESPEETSATGYAHTKRELEREVLRAAREALLPATVLQPTIVYGPYSGPWTINTADMLRYGTVILPDRGEGICNAVYVDDVVSAMILAACHPAALAQRFLISGPEPITWGRFYEEMARAAGAKGPRYLPAEAIARESSKIRKLMRLAADPERVIRRVAQDRRCRKLVEAGIGALPEGMRGNTEHRLFDPPARRRGQVHMPGLGELEFLQSQATISSGKARRELGYAPQFDFTAGMVRTARYLRDVYRMEQTAAAE